MGIIQYLQNHDIYLQTYAKSKKRILLDFLGGPQISKLYREGQQRKPEAGTVLFWMPGGLSLLLHVEAAIAAALQLRGIPVHAVICDGPYYACVRRTVTQDRPPNSCRLDGIKCKVEPSAILRYLRVPYSHIGDYVSRPNRSELWNKAESVTWETLDDLSYRDINLGKNTRSAIYRYLKGCEVSGHDEMVRQYAFTSLMTAAAASAAIDKISPSRVMMSHGTYADWGPALRTAVSLGIPVTTWIDSLLLCRMVFRHIEDYNSMHFRDISEEAWEELVSLGMPSEKIERLNIYMQNRYKHTVDFDMKGQATYSGDAPKLREKYSLAPDKPVWGIMCHVNWDNVTDFSPMLYSTFDEWIINTIQEISKIQNVSWLIKIHPAEGWDTLESGVQRLVETHFPTLPDNIQIIPSKEKLSPLDFYELVDGGVTVYGTPGLELALHGKPVILAGSAYYGRRGFTYDTASIDEYIQLLHKAASLGPLNDDQCLLAKKFAYCLFLQRQIPFPLICGPDSKNSGFQQDKRTLLLPGNDPFIDFICERILDGKDFIMDERLVELAEDYEQV